MRMILPPRKAHEEHPPCMNPEDCLAKSLHNGPGCSVYTHLYATCSMFRMLRRIWRGTRKGEFFFPEAEWCAAFHDIGKMTPAFQDKIYRAVLPARPLPWAEPISEQNGGHARSSAIVLESYFHKECPELVRMAGGHHGAFYEFRVGDNIGQKDLGGLLWQQMREKTLRELTEKLNLPKCDLKSIPAKSIPIMLGSVILADWLSSGLELGPGSPPPDDATLRRTVEAAGLVPHRVRSDRTFPEIFGFAPNALQKACLEHIVPGGIYVIESGMGSGKTEAALGIACELMRGKQADGIYFALPTRLTSEKIYDRLNSFLRKTLREPDPAILIHGDSWLDWTLPHPDENGNSTPIGNWFQTKKRALLASFGAGTVDQALLAEVRVRHNFLRAFALAGKVVVFDEIHSYDAYTGSLLAKLIGDLRQWGCTVILLSATLTAEACRLFAQLKEPPRGDDYPRILINDRDRVTTIPLPAPEPCQVLLDMTEDEDGVLREAIARAEAGEQVLWIENTVKLAQSVFRLITALAPDLEIALIHSRFPACIRAEKEDYWTALLGKNGADKRVRHGRILVATQILEQSVDVDADLLISRIAPADFLFQRIGRLWRHHCLDGVRPGGARRRCIVLAPGVLADPAKLEREQKSFRPYSTYWIRRTWEILREKTSLLIPGDIRPVLEALYREREESGPLKRLQTEDERKKETLLHQADMAVARYGEWQNDDSFAATRFSEEQTVQLLLLRKGNCGERLSRRIYPYFSRKSIVLPDASSSGKERLEAARKLLPLLLRVPARQAPAWSDFPADFLGGVLWVGDGENRPLRAAYVDDAGRLLDQSCNFIETEYHFQAEYHPNLGYISRKAEG